MPLKVRVLVCLVVAALFLVPTVSSQVLEKGTISGTVLDPTGAAIPNATVKITHVNTGAERTVTTGPDGRYSAPILSAGEYTIEVTASGFATTIVRNVRLSVGQELIQDVGLKVAAVGQVVEVTAESGPIDRSEALEKVVIDATYVDQLPISGRDFRDFVTLAGTGDTSPGLRSPVRLGGQQGEYTGLIIDGVDNRDGFFGEWFGSLETKNFTVPQDSVQEFQVREGGFSAEFGHATGGLINVVTKSGGNDFHGTVHWFFQSNSFFGDNSIPDPTPTEVPPPFNTRHQFGGTVGGPIVRDRFWFFFAIDTQEQAGPLGTGFLVNPNAPPCPCPVPTIYGGPTLADLVVGTTQRQDLLTPLLRLDYKITNNTTGTSRANYTRNETDNFTGGRSQIFVGDAVQSNFENFVNEGPAFLQSVTTVINPVTVNEARFAYSRERRDRLNNGPGPETTIGGVGTFGQRFFLPITGHTQRFQVIDNFSRTFGKHDLKLGVDLNSVATNQVFIGFAGGVYNFTRSTNPDPALAAAENLADFNANRPTNYRQLFGINGFSGIESGALSDFWQHELSWYIQDSWKIHPRLTLNLGLRWDGIWNPNPEFPILGDLVALGEPRIRNGVLEQEVGPPPQGIPDDFNNWAPRVGVAWDATGDGKTIVRGGLGIYYAPFPTIFMASTLSGMGFRGADTFIPFDPATGMDTLGLGLTYPNLLRSPTETLDPADPADSLILGLLPPPNITFVDPELESPRVFNLQLGVEREIVTDLSISGTYSYNRSENLRTGGFNSAPWDRTIDPSFVTGFDQFGRTVGLGDSTPGDGACDGLAPALAFEICRLPQTTSPISGANALSSFGRARYHAFVFQVKKAYSHRHQFQINYVLSKNEDNATTDRDTDAFFGPSDPFNLDLDYGRGQLDIRHQFRAFGYFLLPWDIEFSTIITARSGRAFPAYRGFCPGPGSGYQDGFQCANFFLSAIRPALADGSGLLPRFPFRNRNFYNWDIRFGRAFPLGSERLKLRATFEVFNLTDRNNAFSTTTGFTINGMQCEGLSSECLDFGAGPDARDNPTLPINYQFGLKLIF